MADIFISYSKTDRMLVERLASYLEAAGWSVWWDRGLSAGDQYRDDIMRELVGARAVIVLWTDNSIRSDWVRAEAGRAKADRKLIPVKSASVGYGDIPLPFGEMHTEPVENLDLIRAAVVGQLAKPAETASTFGRAAAALRFEALSWIGIVGGAITLFSNLKGIVQLADWAAALVHNWRAWMHAVWVTLFGWLGITLPVEWSSALTFGMFAFSTIIGSRMASASASGLQPASGPSISTRQWGTLVLVFGLCVIVALIPALAVLEQQSPSRSAWTVPAFILGLLACPVALTLIWRASHDRRATLLLMVLYAPFVVVLGLFPFAELKITLSSAVSLGICLLLSLSTLPLALAMAPARALNRRFLTIVVGVSVLYLANELAKLQVGQFLPK